jgi:hypothetical protein
MKLLVTMTTLFTFSFVAQASITTIETKSESSAPSAKIRNGWEIGIGTQRLSYDLGDQGSESANGYLLIGSKNFTLSDSFSTKSTLKVGNAKNIESRSDFDTDTEFSTTEFSQNIAYSFNQYGVTFRPYLSIGYGSGDYEQITDGFNADTRSALGFNSLKTTAQFSSQTTSIGLQVLFNNGLAPYISYNTTTISFDNEENFASRNSSKDGVSIKSSLGELYSRAISTGIIYTF